MLRIPSKVTHYKGIKFRSGIEARWAIVYDSLGIAWKYEIKHYDFGLKKPWLEDKYEFNDYLQEALNESYGEDRSDVISGVYREKYERDMYLPDFWLPDFNHWVEIKGKPPDREEVNKATSLQRRTGNPVSILWGYIPDPKAMVWGECSEIYGGNMNIIALLVLECGTKAMKNAFTAGRSAHFS